jgi:hypothetical protein
MRDLINGLRAQGLNLDLDGNVAKIMASWTFSLACQKFRSKLLRATMQRRKCYEGGMIETVFQNIRL